MPSMDNRRPVLILSDFNAGNLAGYLTNDMRQPLVDVRVGPMGHGMGLLLQQDAHASVGSHEDVIVWTQPHRVSDVFASLLSGEHADVAVLLAQVDEFAAGLSALAQNARAVLVPTWVMPHAHRGFGLLGMREGVGPVHTLMRMNLRLSAQLAGCQNVHVLDGQRWMQAAGGEAHNARLWYLGKIPFGNAVFKEAAADIKAALRGIAGETRKLIIVDLDNTLWGGVLGDEGWERLRVGGHDALGEAHADFQRGLKALGRRGIILGIVSKNDEAPALEAIAKHPEMVLTVADFAGWRINWEDKAANVAALTAELNLGLQSVVFIDDNPVERDRVRKALPEVLVPEWPPSALLFPSALAGLDSFDTVAVTAEDRTRQASYRAESARIKARDASESLDEWLRGLRLKVHITELNDANATRVTQLLNKTNQMNLSTRRLTESALRAWASVPQHKVWAFRVIDKFEDAGLTGILSLALDGTEARIVDFVLSCRVIGRQVEEAMLYQAVRYASEHGLQTLCAEYVPTGKNEPCLRFLQRAGLEHGNGDVFRWDLRRPFGPPRHIEFDVLAQQPV
jgi:FkbH-like protein